MAQLVYSKIRKKLEKLQITFDYNHIMGIKEFTLEAWSIYVTLYNSVN